MTGNYSRSFEATSAGRMSFLFAQQASNATAGQRRSVRYWQRRDRSYERVQSALSGLGAEASDVLRVASDLVDLAVPVPEDVRVWRGIRSIERTFHGVLAEGRFVGVVERFMSTTVYRRIARHEFTEPGASPAILAVYVRQGVFASWLPPIGGGDSASQGELLLSPGCFLRILEVSDSSAIVSIEVEVAPL